jgi:glycosyltransferase involved in cell wall biosynthesis
MSNAALSVFSPVVTVLLPVCNEEERVTKAITGLARLYTEQEAPFELLVIDNGSVDNTIGLLALLRRAVPELRVYSLPKRVGQGAAIREGIKRARGRYVLLCNTQDLSRVLSKNPRESLARALELVEAGYHLVIAEQVPPEEPSLRGFGIDLVGRLKKGLDGRRGSQSEASLLLIERYRAIELSELLKDTARGAPELVAFARERKHRLAELIRPGVSR